jgi:hypothetical protein
MIVRLGETEQKVCEYVAKERYNNARRKGITDNKKGPQSNYDTDLEGVASEMAAAKLLNVWPDIQIEEIPTHDLILGTYTIDVKATKYRTGKLIAALHKKDKACDYYMLMLGTFPEYSLGGFCRKEKLLNEDTITNLGWGQLHALEQNDLMSLDEFKKETML